MWFWTILSLGAPDKSKMTTPKRSPSQLSDILSTKRENSAIFRNANDQVVKLVKSKSSKVTKPPLIRSLAADIVWILPFIVNWKNNSTVNCGQGGKRHEEFGQVMNNAPRICVTTWSTKWLNQVFSIRAKNFYCWLVVWNDETITPNSYVLDLRTTVNLDVQY